MQVSLAWLRDLVDVTDAPAEVARRLTGVGVAVDTVERPGVAARGIVAGRALAVASIAAAKNLWVCQVDVGEAEPLQIVTGADNVRVGDLVPVALPGSVLPGGKEIGVATFRGVESAGMLCAPDELGISEGHAAIMTLPPDVTPGVDLVRLLGLDDAVLGLDLTANYAVHCQCMIGVAQEYAALTDQALEWPLVVAPEQGTDHIADVARVRIDDPDLCMRYAARLISGVTIGPSPLWLQTRLRAAGMRPINNVVDITNLVMLELGQPLHAFDFTHLAGRIAIARRATPGETLTTLDGQHRVMDPDVLVIADAGRAQVIAGVMGGEDSEVTPATTEIFLEAAWFHNINNRRTARRYALFSEASSRFTKGVDPSGALRALDRAAALMAELAGGRVVPGVLDAYPQPVAPAVIPLRKSMVRTMLGLDLDLPTMSRQLQRLGFGIASVAELQAAAAAGAGTAGTTAGGPLWNLLRSVSPLPVNAEVLAAWRSAAARRIAAAAQTVARWTPADQAAALVVVVPTRRLDIAIEVDLTEEVARVYGYDQIQATLPEGTATRGGRSRQQEQILAARRILTGAGLAEATTYSLTTPRVDDRLLLPVDDPARQHLTLSNPMYDERSALRTLLMPSLLDAAQYNVNRQVRDVALYEIASVYLPVPGETLPREELRLSLVAHGNVAAKDWLAPAQAADFYWLKGVIEHLLERLGVFGAEFGAAAAPWLHPGRQAELRVAAAPGAAPVAVGVFGELHPAVQEAWGLPGRTYVAELAFDALAAAAVAERPYRPVPRHPAAPRDVSLVIDRAVPAERVLATIRTAAGELAEEVRLFDLYQGPPVPDDKRSLAYSISYRAADRTLTDAEVEGAHGQVRAALAALGAELRS